MLELSITFPIHVQNGGLFISRGIGSHPARTLTSWEVIFVERGELQIREDDRLFTVQEGESLLLRPGHRHVGEGVFPANLKFYWLHFEWLKDSGEAGLHLALLSVPQHTRVSDPQYIISLFRQFLSEQEKVHRGIALECILLLILQRISAPGAQESIDNSNPGLALAWKAHQIIRTQFHLPLSTSSMAKELHCNADYLGRVYRRTFYMTLTEALHRQRVLMAEKLLINNSLSLTEVGHQCGFNDASYFRQIFRKHTGMTPKNWKRHYCKEHINS